MWIYEAARPDTPPYMIYEFTENRSHDHPIRFMKNFKETIHADAFQAYISIHKNSDIPISWAACWAHGRRKFIEAQYGDQKFKNNILRMIKNLFRYERVAWNQNSENRLKIRNELELPIVDELFALLKNKVTIELMLPKAKMTEAIN